jgi:23S rRNA (guanosine2251-2'-O)-methyltransferase
VKCRPEDSAEDGTRVVGGLNAVTAALKSRPRACRNLLLADSRGAGPALTDLVNLARAAGLAVRRSPRSALNRLYGRETHQGVVAVFDPLDYTGLDDFLAALPSSGPALILALDQVADPGNLGALMRSALAFGAAGVLVPRERTAPLTPAAIRASAGAAESLPLVRVVNLRRALENLQKAAFWLVGAEGGGNQSLFDFNFPDRAVIVLGSEGRGLSPLLQKTCDFLVAIPQRREAVSSLNVSVAGGVLMAEYCRQHRS